jgi:tetratricopeptide (TPR) repeat protein
MEPGISRPARRRSQVWLQLTLIIGFTFCLILGVGALAALFLVQAEPTVTVDPAGIPGYVVGEIAPAHALLQLAGDPPGALATQALQAGELDLAASIVTFAVQLNDRDRLNTWLQLGRRYLAAEQTDRAIRSYQNARTVVVTGFGLTASERSQALIQIAEGLVQADDTAAALDAAQQVRLLAEQTPDLLPAQRMQIVDALRPVATALNDDLLSSSVDILARNPYLAPAGILLEERWGTLGAPLEIDVTVDSAAALRRQAARGLADRMAAAADSDPERQTLAAALVAEDQTRATAFQAQLNAGLTLEEQFTLLMARRAWLGLKLRVAAGGFGLSLVPDWEAQLAAIRQELAAATNNVVNVVDAIVAAEPDPVIQATLRTQTHLWLAQQAEFGLDPDRSVQDLDASLRFTQAELLRLGQPPALPVFYFADATPPGFRFGSPAALQ